LDKLIPEALPLLEAPPVVRSVHLNMLLRGVTFICSSSANALPLSVFLGQGRVKTHMKLCVEIFETDSPVERGVWSNSAAKVGPSAGVRCDLPRSRPHFSHITANCITQTCR